MSHAKQTKQSRENQQELKQAAIVKNEVTKPRKKAERPMDCVPDIGFDAPRGPMWCPTLRLIGAAMDRQDRAVAGTPVRVSLDACDRCASLSRAEETVPHGLERPV